MPGSTTFANKNAFAAAGGVRSRRLFRMVRWFGGRSIHPLPSLPHAAAFPEMVISRQLRPQEVLCALRMMQASTGRMRTVLLQCSLLLNVSCGGWNAV